MKLSLWMVSLPIIALCSLFQITFDLGEQGKLDSPFLRNELYPISRSINGIATNIKFRWRGIRKPQQKIVIVAADDLAMNHLGRWPWHREVFADVIYTTFKMGAKYVGMDVVFSEPEERIPKDVYTLLEKKNSTLINEIKNFEGDPVFAQVMKQYRDRLVLGYSAQAFCQPRYDLPKDCPIHDEGFAKDFNEQLQTFALPERSSLSSAEMDRTPLPYMLTTVANIAQFRDSARFAGNFFISPDPDGYIRRYPLIFVHDREVYPSLALSMASLALQDSPHVEFTNDARIKKMNFSKTPDQIIPTTSLGYIDLNFKGPSESFLYISAWDVLRAATLGSSDPLYQEIKKSLDNSLVLFGVSALGIYDMRAFPFDSNTPGVEGHATALDNLLSNDPILSPTSLNLDWLPLLLLLVFGFGFAFLFSKFEAVPSLLMFAGFIAVVGFIDIWVLFSHQINLPTAFLNIEILGIFILILAIRYILEERNKKFIRSAFSRYLAPQVVDLVLKDPSKLAVGGERRDLSILFSDLRGFTTISEGMEPKVLSQFLNEYLSEMTEIVFEMEGTLDKYIGDAIMAFWGAPIHQMDHATRAAQAAVKMHKKLREIAPKIKEKYNVDVGMGVGLNSGMVSVGNMGSDRIFEYTVIGDHVNLASRLESLTRLYGVDVICTRNTLNAIQDPESHGIFFRVIDLVKVKGKTQSTELVELSDRPFDPEALRALLEGRQKFAERKWDEAKAIFGKFIETDSVCRVFYDRCDILKETPPPTDWDGSAEMLQK